MEPKYAVMTMDVEDWYHTGYLNSDRCDKSLSVLNTVERFAEILEAEGAHATFFVLGELIQGMQRLLNQLAVGGHEIASHGWCHTPPLQLSLAQFLAETHQCQSAHKDHLTTPLEGYRAALFRMDRPRLDIVMDSGFLYDSSSTARPRKGSCVDLAGFTPVRTQIFRRGGFYEFQAGTQGPESVFISGGGGTRILPWGFSLTLLKRHLQAKDFYNFYTHPLDVSPEKLPVPRDLSWLAKYRLLAGRKSMMGKLEILLKELKRENYEFVTFSALRRKLYTTSKSIPENSTSAAGN
jgi:peptidoglycan/xylan/chitin deacetylase (PgdA/CDA1 family)